MPSLPPRRRDSALQFVCPEPCSLRLRPRSSTSRVVISRLPHVRFRYSLVTHNHPFNGLVGRLQSLGFPPPCYPSYGAPTLTPVGLPPTECASLSWMHGPAQRSLSLWPARSRSRLATLPIESSAHFVTSAVVSVATGWSESVPGVGIEPRRAHFVIQDRVTFPRAPLQSRKVGFPDSGFDLGFSREVFPKQAKLKCSLTCTSTYSGLPRSSSLESWLLRLESLTIPRTAKCPELLCPSQALLMMGWCPAPPRRALLLLPRSYELMRQTSSLLWNSCIHTYLPRSVQVAVNPCWKLVLPDVISASVSQDA